MTESDINQSQLRARAIRAAQGLEPFDRTVCNALLLDLVTHRERHVDIGIVGGLIATVQDHPAGLKSQHEIDAQGRWVMPGLIDMHMHVESSMITPFEYVKATLPRGVTTIVWDPHEFANVAGLDGVTYAIDASRATCARFLTLAPTCVPSAPGFERTGADFSADMINHLLDNQDIHGAAELMTMRPLLNGDARVLQILEAARSSKKRICGHGRGLEGGDLAAYRAAGVQTDHELSSGADLVARLEAGFTVELRVSHAHLLPEFAQTLNEIGHLPPTLTFCTDDIFPDDLLSHGGLDHMVRLMIKAGLPVPWAYQAASFNAATQLNRTDLGIIAPGRRADMILLDDLAQVAVSMVLVDGQVVARDGQMMADMVSYPTPKSFQKSIELPAFVNDDFEIKVLSPQARIRTLSRPRFPQWGERTLSVKDGKLVLPDDMIRMAVANRYGAGTPTRVAFMENWGTWRAAFATSVSHDSHNLTMFGTDPSDMALAANTVRDSGGGLCVASSGKIIAHLPLPLAGLVSDQALETVAAEFKTLRSAMDEFVDWEPPYLVFKALFGASLVCNAGPRLSDVGLVDPFENTIVSSPIIEAI